MILEPCNPMKAINKPIPAVIECFKLSGIELIKTLRNFVKDNTKNISEAMNTAPSAFCQVIPSANTTAKAKNKG